MGRRKLKGSGLTILANGMLGKLGANQKRGEGSISGPLIDAFFGVEPAPRVRAGRCTDKIF